MMQNSLALNLAAGFFAVLLLPRECLLVGEDRNLPRTSRGSLISVHHGTVLAFLCSSPLNNLRLNIALAPLLIIPPATRCPPMTLAVQV